MKKRDFYIAAMKAGTYRTTAWNVACFGLTSEGSEEWKKKPYPYRLVSLPNGYHFVNPDNTDELIRLEDGEVGKPLFARNEPIELAAGDVPNVYSSVSTTYGNVLANYLILVHAFNNKIPFITGRFSTKKVEAIIEKRIKQRPEPYTPELLAVDEKDPLNAPIYVDEYLSYCDGAFSIVAYTQLFTPANTRKTMTQPPGIVELRNKLLEQYKGQLHDRAVVAKIAEELQAADAAYLKGDRGTDFLTSDKSLKIVRSRMYLMYGAETGIEEKIDVNLIERSLAEGWDVDQMPAMIDALRAGSFNRGKQTELGGEAVKDLFRASGNFKIAMDDCGSKVGVGSVADKNKPHDFIGFSYIDTKGNAVKVENEEQLEAIHGRYLKWRSPMACVAPVTDYCKVCLGDRLANNPTGLSMAVADYGSTFLSLFLSAAHSKGLQVAKLDIDSQLM